MKKILIATACLAGLTFAATPTTTTAPSVDTAKMDSLRKERAAVVDSIMKVDRVKDSTLIADLRKAIPDSLKGKMDTATKAWTLGKGGDSTKIDSIKKSYTGKRDSLISKIKDTAAASKIKARIAALETEKAALKARLDARKTEIDAKLEALKAKLGKK